MRFRHNGFDLWVFHRQDPEPKYLLLHASLEKARKWFNGSQLWQIPSDFVEDGEALESAVGRELARFGQTALALWAVEHSYTIYNPRYGDTVLFSVFAAEVSGLDDVTIDSAHASSEWVTGAEASRRVSYRGLKEGLHWLQHFITEAESPGPEFRLS